MKQVGHAHEPIDLLNKFVVLEVRMPNGTPRFYNGKFIKLEEENYVIKDVELGVTPFPRKRIVNIREMEKIDMIELARKQPRIAMKLKFQQADERIIKNCDEFFVEIKKKIGWS